MKYHGNFKEWYHSRMNPIGSYVILSRFDLHPRNGLHLWDCRFTDSRLECGHPWTNYRLDWVRTIQWHAQKYIRFRGLLWLGQFHLDFWVKICVWHTGLVLSVGLSYCVEFYSNSNDLKIKVWWKIFRIEIVVPLPVL